MKILGILPVSIGGRLTTSSILDGFRLLNHSVTIYDELNDDYKLSNDFDLIVGYDFSALKLKKDNNLTMKSINYFSDVIRDKTSGPYWQELLSMLESDDNYTFYWDRELFAREKFNNIFYLPHFVNTDVYKSLNIEPECDVMFAGRLDTDYRLNLITNLVKALPRRNFRWYAIKKHYKDALNRVEDKKIIEKIYSGFIDNEKDMAKAINKTKIVLNMNSQGISSLNYRSMQTIACGKLLISDSRGELDLFDNKIPVYSDEVSLKNLVEYYLLHNDEYEKITEFSQNICRSQFNSKVGVEYMLDKIYTTP